MKKAKGTFFMRSQIFLLAALFGVLVYWSIGFLLNDIKVFQEPDREEFFEQHTDQALEDRLQSLETQLQQLEHQENLLNRQRGFIKDSSESLKITVDNLFKLKSKDQQLLSQEQFNQLIASLEKMIEIQKEYKSIANRYVEITNDKYEVKQELQGVKKQIKTQSEQTAELFRDAFHSQRVKATVLRMVFLVPLIIICAIIFFKNRQSIYRMIYVSAALAVCIKTAAVMHERFPTRYFKYILMVCMLALVGWGFVWLTRRLVKPKLDILLKQYRQAYERFLCPVCEYPIRRGPRKYLYWTRRTVHKSSLNDNLQAGSEDEKPYVCPACGTELFEKCQSCGAIRYSLLPNCQFCGDEKSVTEGKY